MDFLFEAVLEIFGEFASEPFRLFIHWIVRSLGGHNPRYFRVWALLCRVIIWSAVLMFFGTIGSIIEGFIGPYTMLWLFIASITIFLVGLCALSAVEGTG
jgi:hypothetical protein